MTAAGIATVSLFAPMVASNAIFSARRAKRGLEAIDENPVYALTNFDIAAGQVLKGSRAAKALSAATSTTETVKAASSLSTTSAVQSIKEVSNTSKCLKGVNKVINLTADYINPIICVGGAIKVLGSEDKTDAAAREILSLGTMFAAEGCAKKLLGMPKAKRELGKIVYKNQTGLIDEYLQKNGDKIYKKLFNESQRKAMTDFTKSKQFVKYLPGALKGLLFVGASIGGYKLGEAISNNLLGKKKEAN